MDNLIINGDSVDNQTLSYRELCQFSDQCDAHDLDPKKTGKAIALKTILNSLNIFPQAKYITFYASIDHFSASVPLSLIADQAWLIYSDEDQPLTTKKGGPYRLLVPNPQACQTGELDECVNVKYIDKIEISHTKGTDTRPQDEKEHAHIHKNELI